MCIILSQLGVTDIKVSYPPSCYEVEFQTILTPNAVKFVAELVREFNRSVDEVSVFIIIWQAPSG